MLTSKKLLACLIASSQLVACGGGGGGSGGGSDDSPNAEETRSFSTQAQADSYYQELANSVYEGEASSAELSEQNLLAFTSYLFGTEEDEPSGPILASASNASTSFLTIKTLAENNIQVMNSVKEKSVVGASSSSISSDVTSSAVTPPDTIPPEMIIVDETYNCESGSMTHKGQLNEYGIGVINVTFNACQYGDTTTDGKGHISYNSSYGGDFTFYYDGVTVAVLDTIQELNGYVGNTLSDNPRTSFYNLTITDTTTQFQIKYSNYLESFNVYENELSLTGDLYFSDIGYVTVTTQTDIKSDNESVESGSLTLANGTQSGQIIFYSEQNIVVSLDADNDGEPEIGILLSDTSELSEDNIETLQFIAYGDINMSPVAGNPRIYYEDYWQRDTRFPIYAENPSVSDPENDPITFVEYRWYVNDELVLTTTTNEFPPHTAFHGDEVGVRVLVSDGQNQTLSGMAVLTVGDAPSVLEVSDVPASFSPGDVVSFTAAMIDPDTPNQPTSAVLEGAPEGMTIDDEGQVTWTAVEPEFGDHSLYQIKVSESEQRYTQPIIITFTVEAADTASVIARSTPLLPDGQPMYAADFDNDGQKEILSAKNNQVMLLALDGDQYIQDWLYPYRLPSRGNIRDLQVYDVNGDTLLDIVVGTSYGVSVIYAGSMNAELMVDLEQKQLLKFSIGKLTETGNPSLLMLLDSSSNKLVEVRDIVTGSSTSLFVGSGASSVVIGNLDSDSAQEIVTNNGYVYDGSSFQNQWYYSQGFGQRIVVGDLDADGIDEIVSMTSSSDGGIKIFDPVSKEIILTENSYYSSWPIAVGNIDQDAQEELIVGYSYHQGGVVAYDVSSGTLTIDATWQASEYGSIGSIAVENIDNDPEFEVLYRYDSKLAIVDNSVVTLFEGQTMKSSVVNLGWGSVNGENKALFMSDTKTLASMNFDSGVESVTTFSFSASETETGLLFDYDADGTDELFLGLDSYYNQPAVLALNYTDASVKWSGASDRSYFDVELIKPLNGNNDDVYDVVYAKGSVVYVMDMDNDVLLNSDSSLGSEVSDIVVADFNGDGKDDYAVGNWRKVQIWSQTDTGFELFAESSEPGCDLLEVVDVDDDTLPEITCASTRSTGILSILDSDLSEINRFDFKTDLYEIVVDPMDSTAVYIAKAVGDSYYSRFSYLTKVSAVTGNVLWNGFEVIGRVNKDSWHIRSAEEANGGARMSIGTDKAMYLIQ